MNLIETTPPFLSPTSSHPTLLLSSPPLHPFLAQTRSRMSEANIAACSDKVGNWMRLVSFLCIVLLPPSPFFSSLACVNSVDVTLLPGPPLMALPYPVSKSVSIFSSRFFFCLFAFFSFRSFGSFLNISHPERFRGILADTYMPFSPAVFRSNPLFSASSRPGKHTPFLTTSIQSAPIILPNTPFQHWLLFPLPGLFSITYVLCFPVSPFFLFPASTSSSVISHPLFGSKVSVSAC